MKIKISKLWVTGMLLIGALPSAILALTGNVYISVVVQVISLVTWGIMVIKED